MKYYAVIDTNVIVSAVMAFNKSNEDLSSNLGRTEISKHIFSYR